MTAPGGLRLARRRRRWLQAGRAEPAARARAAWAQVVEDAGDLGWEDRPAESVRSSAQRLTQWGMVSGAAAEALGRLAVAVEQARYAATGPTPAQTAGLPADVRLVRSALARRRRVGRRVRAVLLPPATLRTAGAWTSARVADAFDLVDRVGAAVRRLGRAARPDRAGAGA